MVRVGASSQRTVEQVDLVVGRLAVAGHAPGAQPVEDRRCVSLDVPVDSKSNTKGMACWPRCRNNGRRLLWECRDVCVTGQRCHWLLSSVILSPKWIVTAFRVGFQPFILPTRLPISRPAVLGRPVEDFECGLLVTRGRE